MKNFTKPTKKVEKDGFRKFITQKSDGVFKTSSLFLFLDVPIIWNSFFVQKILLDRL